MKTIILQPQEICNPLRGEYVHPPICTDELIMPMDELYIAMPLVIEENGMVGFVKRYRVRVIHAHVRPVGGFTQKDLSCRIEQAERIRMALDHLSDETEISHPETPQQDHRGFEWHLLCDPIEDDIPSCWAKELWRIGRHGQWCSITIPKSKSFQIFCVRTDKLFGEQTSDQSLFSGRNDP